MLRKYQIDAIVSKITKKLNEKLENVRVQLRASWKPSQRQKECLDEMDELMEIAEKMQRLRARAQKLGESINDKASEEVNIHYYYYDFCPSTVKNNKESFINSIINKKLKDVPSYQDIADDVTVATISAGFDIETWINDFVDKVKLCEE
jgi:hypothetical protein